ncbi:MAG: acireductone synthase [Polyangiaceae bacterium]
MTSIGGGVSSAHGASKPRAILTDIEGTTSSIAFVKEVLFPFARKHLAAFVSRRAADPEVRTCLDATRALESNPSLSDAAVIDVLVRWIDEDRKATPLKTLQGLIWADGYATGEIKSHIYDDAAAGLAKWHAAGHALFIFSSGSIAAQKLLFAHTARGDLTPLFTGYFDTTIGPKLKADSYTAIASAIARPPSEVLFLSDHTGELDAAVAAGMHVVCLDRGEAVIPAETPHRRVHTFDEIHPEE